MFITSDSYSQNGQDSVFYSDSILMEYNNAQNMYQSGNYETALAIFKRTGDRCMEIQAWKYYCHSIIGMANCHRKLGEMDKAIFYLDEAEGL